MDGLAMASAKITALEVHRIAKGIGLVYFGFFQPNNPIETEEGFRGF